MACMKDPQEIRRMEIKKRIQDETRKEELRFGWSMPMARKKRSQNLIGPGRLIKNDTKGHGFLRS